MNDCNDGNDLMVAKSDVGADDPIHPMPDTETADPSSARDCNSDKLPTFAKFQKLGDSFVEKNRAPIKRVTGKNIARLKRKLTLPFIKIL